MRAHISDPADPTPEDDAAFNALGLDCGNWPDVFKYADSDGIVTAVPEGGQLDGFRIGDVKRIDGSVDGEPDGEDWVAFGELNDGRWFCVTAGCDYTGWG
jgi:hypothetical protein